MEDSFEQSFNLQLETCTPPQKDEVNTRSRHTSLCEEDSISHVSASQNFYSANDHLHRGLPGDAIWKVSTCDDFFQSVRLAANRSVPRPHWIPYPVNIAAASEFRWSNGKLELVAKFIRDRGAQHDVLETELRQFRTFITGRPPNRLQAVQCGLVPVVMTCIKTAPSHLLTLVVQTLRELTINLSDYPAGIDDAALWRLCTLLTQQNPVYVENALAVLDELTQFDQGQCAAYRSNVTVTLGEIISKPQPAEVVIPALKVLTNIANNPVFAGIILSADVLSSFRRTILHQFLSYFQQQKMSTMDSRPLNLMWKIALSDNVVDRTLLLLPQLVRECPVFCLTVLSKWSQVMTQWSKLIEVCVLDKQVFEKVRLDFIETSYIILRYGENACVISLVKLLHKISIHISPEYKHLIIEASIIDAIIQRFPVKQLWARFVEEVQSVRSPFGILTNGRSNIATDVLTLITDLLEALPRYRDKAMHKNNIVETLLKSDILSLAAYKTHVQSTDAMLLRLTAVIDKLTPGWCFRERQIIQAVKPARADLAVQPKNWSSSSVCATCQNRQGLSHMIP